MGVSTRIGDNLIVVVQTSTLNACDQPNSNPFIPAQDETLTLNGFEQPKNNPFIPSQDDVADDSLCRDPMQQHPDSSQSRPYENLSLENQFYVYIDNILGGSCFHDYDAVIDRGVSYNFFSKGENQVEVVDRGGSYNFFSKEDDQVEIEVRATIVSPQTKPLHACGVETTADPHLDNSNFVGDIKRAGVSNFKVGTTVTSLLKCSVQSRFVTLPPELLIPVPPTLDAGEVVTLVSSYLPAFGALHHGSPNRDKRFSSKALAGCNVLITGGATNETDAILKIALLGGANKVYVLASARTKITYHVGSHRVLALNEDPAEWLPRLEKQVDVVIDVGYPKDFEQLKATLTSTGRYVVVVPSRKNDNILVSFVRTALFATNGVFMYDFEEMVENCYEELLSDLEFLFTQLAARKIRPSVDKYIKLRDVSIVQEDMCRQPTVGAVVCEPWRN